MIYTLTPKFDNLSLRQGHETTYAKVGNLTLGQVAEGNEIWVAQDSSYGFRKIGDRWLHVNKLNGVSVDGWMAIVHNGLAYATITERPETPTTDTGVVKVIKAVIYYENKDGQQLTKELFPQ